ncbi:MAG TPA: hypothetical protein PKG52_06970 [bacterium]|nr:hypothetical protein [bacterium]HPS29264.1 hypothetical protein [bacterium]
MEERNFIVTAIYKNFALLLFFVVFNVIIYFFTFMESLNACFPVTVITTDRTQIDNIINDLTVCSESVDTEKMTFDSAIFNHYETPPVKDVYLFSLSFPYEKWDRVKNLDNAITDINPYVEKTVITYNGARIKFFSIAFIIIFGIWLIFTIRIAPSWKKSKHNFFVTAISTVISFTILSFLSCFFASAKTYSFIFISISVFFVTYIIILSIIYRLITIGKTGENR